MPISGERPKRAGGGYIHDPIAAYAKSVAQTAQSMLNESQIDLFMEPGKAFLIEATNETMKNFFVNESCDEKSMTAEELEDHRLMMEALYENDREAVLEYAAISNFNPVIGMTPFMHKNIMMNNIFDKGAIQKAVAVTPKFTLTMETRTMVDVDGNEIDMFKQQHLIKEAMEKTCPVKEVVLNLPEAGTTDILNAIGATAKDNLSIETYVSAVKVSVLNSKNSDTATDVWVPVRLQPVPGYGNEYERTFMGSISVTNFKGFDAATGAVEVQQKAGTEVKDTISLAMAKNRITASSLGAKIKAIKVTTRKDASNGLSNTASVKWGAKTDIVEIPTATPINTPISPEEVKDIAALYGVNQLSKVMAMFKDVMENHKDDLIRENLDSSFQRLAADQKVDKKFDMVPREGYALDHVEWRQKTFFDALDTYVTELLDVLRDPNMTITIFGRPDIIRKIKPTNYTYQSPEAIGPVDLEFERTIMTSDKRTYQFISSQKMNRGATAKDKNSLIIVLNPKNSERIVYRIYDYQMYVSNDIRNASMSTLPAVHAFERWKFLEYQPVQGRVEVLNPTGKAE